jgi:hypothetical protein
MTQVGWPSLTFAGALEKFTRKELETFVSLLQGYLETNHNADGSHSDIKATSCASDEGYMEFGRDTPLGFGVSLRYDPSIYGASGAMTWTPTSTQQRTLRYARVGSLLFYSGQIQDTNVGGVAGANLRVYLPLGLKSTDRQVGSMVYNDAGGAANPGIVLAPKDERYLAMVLPGGANWTITAANNTTVQFTWIGEVY